MSSHSNTVLCPMCGGSGSCLESDLQERAAIIAAEPPTYMDGAAAEAGDLEAGAASPGVLGPPATEEAHISDSPAAPVPAAPSTPTPPAPNVSASEPSLYRFSQELRDYQEATVAEALAHVARCDELPDEAGDAERRILFASPTGSGKGTCLLALLKALRDQGRNAWIYTPSLEVLRGFLERCGADADELANASAEKLAKLGNGIYVTTPTRHRNRILKGEAQVPDVILYDEVHHATSGNEVSGTLFALAPLASWVGFTATPFRGSPKGTLALNEDWPDQVEVLTIPEAVNAGWWHIPRFNVVGLIDDDKVRVVGGDFQAKASGKLVGARIDEIAELVERKWRQSAIGAFVRDRDEKLPTCVVTPSRAAAAQMVEALDRVDVDSIMVIGSTKPQRRAEAYQLTKERRVVLVVVEVLAEGVDLPWLKRIVDCSPTMSPVKWLQRIGRITRPGGQRPEVVVCCRNLERHAYLLGGLIPRAVVAKSQEEFEKPSKRAGARSLGFEALSRFKVIDIPLSGGVRGSGYMLYQASESGVVTEWAVLLDPTSERSVVARRTSHKDYDNLTSRTLDNGVVVESPAVEWGRWEQVQQVPSDLTGFATNRYSGKPSRKQLEWWERCAKRHGLDPEAIDSITRRQFAALPILSQLRVGMHAAPTSETQET